MAKNFALWLLSIQVLLFSPAFADERRIHVATYNAGLAEGFVSYAAERKPYIIDALKDGKPDVLCLQEVWRQDDRRQFKAALRDLYPYAFEAEAQQKYAASKPACHLGDLFGKNKFGNCMASKCALKKGQEFTDCLVNTCRSSIDLLKDDNRECASAVFAQVGANPLSGVAAVLSPFKKVGLFAYEGEAGLLLLSRFPLRNQKVVELSSLSTSNRRAALSAVIEKGKEQVQVLCTHLTANLDKTIPYTGEFDSWQDENLAQVDHLLEHMDQELQDSPQVVMGDFNCSLSNNDFQIAPEQESSCEAIVDAGFYSPLLENPSCTYCGDNLLIQGGDDVMIDHVFFRNAEPYLSYGEVYLKDAVSLEVGQKAIQSHLSDHFGVWVYFQLNQ